MIIIKDIKNIIINKIAYDTNSDIGQCNIFCVNCSQTIEKRTNLLYD